MTDQRTTGIPGQSASTSRPAPTTILATRPLMGWRGVDLITAAMLAVAFGVMFWGFDTFIYPILTTATAGFPPAGELMLGVWLVPAVVGALVIRRPGAALFTELVAANVELFLGNKWGVAVLLSGVLQGLGVELALALFRHRRFGVIVAVLGGALAAALEIVFYEWYSYVADYSMAWKVIYLGCGMVSGAAVAGVGGWALVRGLAGTGALNAFPPGREIRESTRSETTLAGAPSVGGGALVEVRDLTWRPFGRREPVLSGVNLRVEPGSHVLLAGPSGAGKSTLLRALAGVLTTTESGDLSGSVLIDGAPPAGSLVGLMMQDPDDALVAGRVGRDVAFGPESFGMPRDEIWSRVRSALASVGFPYDEDRPTSTLSGGGDPTTGIGWCSRPYAQAGAAG